MQFIMASQKLLMDLSSVAAHLAALCLARGCCIQTWCFDQVVQRSRVRPGQSMFSSREAYDVCVGST